MIKPIFAPCLLAVCAMALNSCATAPDPPLVEEGARKPGVEILEFSVDITAPAETVWNHVTGLESYKKWTTPFMEGSYFEGDWSEGERMHFLAPDGSGMVAVIAENRPHEYLSIEHLGFVVEGVADTTSDAVRSWAPAYENYRFASVPGGTRMSIEQEVLPDYVDYMNSTWPRALSTLKSLCETNGGQ